MDIRCMKCMKQYSDEYDICPHCGYIRGSEPEEAYQLKSETVLNNRYVIGVAVGIGGFGITYKAWDMQLDKIVAIKEFFPSTLVNRDVDGVSVHLYSQKNEDEFDKGLMRFLQEGKQTAKFGNHPNIVNVFDMFQENNTAYLVMEFLDGLSLKDYILLNEGSIDSDTAIDILLSVITALKALHKSKIIHRDISPDNIFICLNKKIKLIDLGASIISNEDEKTKSVVLKPGYAPPEQYRNKSKQGPWTDIYALGATMYFALTGIVPDESVDRVANDELKSPKEINPDIPDYIDTALMVAMALTPELRFQNVSQFEEAILKQRKVRSVEQDLKRRKKRRILTVGFVTILLMIGGVLTFALYNKFRFDAELEETEITVWISASQENLENAKSIFHDRISQFATDYPHIKIDVQVFDEDIYYQELSKAAKENNLPDLFISTYADEETLCHTIELNQVFRAINKDDLYLLSDYKKYFPNKNQMPTGINIAIVFESEISDSICTENSREKFLEGKSKYYITGTTEYNNIQSLFGGKYNICYQENADDFRVYACFLDAWSVSEQSDKKQQAASERVISYLLGEMGQDVYYNQNAYGTPLNKNCFSEYIKINWELNKLDSYMDSLYLDKKYLFDLEEQCDKEYESIIGREE